MVLKKYHFIFYRYSSMILVGIEVTKDMPDKSLELKHTIKLIRELPLEIAEIYSEIKKIMNDIA